MIDSLAPHISQAERLALCPVSEFVTIREDEQESETSKLSAKRRRLHALCAKPKGWTMPSRARCGMVSILPHGMADDEQGEAFCDDESGQEQEREPVYAPYVLPSARNRSAVSRELRAMGFSWGE